MTKVPSQIELMWPVLKALENKSGSAFNNEILEEVIKIMQLSNEVLSVLHGEEQKSEVEYRLGWARTRLKRIGAIKNIGKGQWAITDFGRNCKSDDEVRKLSRETEGKKAKLHIT